MNIKQLQKLDKRELSNILKTSYEKLREANQTIYQNSLLIRDIEALLLHRQVDKTDPENIINSKILWRLREFDSDIRTMTRSMEHIDKTYKAKTLELINKDYTLDEVQRILQKPDHTDTLAKMDYLEQEKSILLDYLEFVKTNKPDTSRLNGTFLEGWTIETTDDYPPFKIQFGQPYGYPTAKELCCEHLLTQR